MLLQLVACGRGVPSEPPSGPCEPPRAAPSTLAAIAAERRWSVPVPSAVALLAIGDHDGDGVDDAILGGTGEVIVAGGTGREPVAIAAAPGSAVVVGAAVGDLDADGIPDLVVAAEGAQGVQVVRATGTVTLAPPPARVGIADVDVDGLPDVVGAIGTGLAWWRNGGGGAFADVAVSVAADAPEAETLLVADLDRDGRTDVVVSSDDAAIAWWNEGGTFSPAALPTAVSDVADLDGDGLLDLVCRSGCRLAGQPGRSFAPIDHGLSLARAADPDGDGVLDLVGSAAVEGGALGMTSANAPPDTVPVTSAHVGPGTVERIPGGAEEGWETVDVLPDVRPADLDGDGRTGLVAFGSDAGVGTLSGAEWDDAFWPPRLPLEAGRGVLATDIDGDGDSDLVVLAAEGRPAVLGVARDGGRGAVSSVALPAPADALGYTQLGGLAAVEGGVAVANLGLAEVQVVGWDGEQPVLRQAIGVPGLAGPLAGGDLDGDGTIDLVAATAGRPVWISGRDVRPISARPASAVVVADLDGDCLAEVITEHEVLGWDGEAVRRRGTVPAPWAPFAVGDLDGDADPDLVASADDQLAVLWNRREGLVAEQVDDAGPTGAVVADLDGDAVGDLVIADGEALRWRAPDGAWRALLLGPSRTLAHLTAADLDGDGATDLAAAGAASGVVLLTAR